MEKDISYYSKGIRRKITAFAFSKGLIKNRGQQKLIEKFLVGINHPIKSKFNPSYLALAYLDDGYSERLMFEKEIAIAEMKGSKNPLTPAIYSLHAYNQGKIDLFKTHCTYLKNIAIRNGEQCYWEYSEDVVRFVLPAPWVSGISQGVIASAMLRMFHEINEQEYFDLAKGAISYCLDAKNGLKTELPNGFWVEEYPTQKGLGVLNGYLFFLLALSEISSFGVYEDEFNEGVVGLLSKISYYHKGIYLKYGSNIPDLCNPMYDRIHFHQMDALYILTKEITFLKLRDYWRNTSSTVFKT